MTTEALCKKGQDRRKAVEPEGSLNSAQKCTFQIRTFCQRCRDRGDFDGGGGCILVKDINPEDANVYVFAVPAHLIYCFKCEHAARTQPQGTHKEKRGSWYRMTQIVLDWPKNQDQPLRTLQGPDVWVGENNEYGWLAVSDQYKEYTPGNNGYIGRYNHQFVHDYGLIAVRKNKVAERDKKCLPELEEMIAVGDMDSDNQQYVYVAKAFVCGYPDQVNKSPAAGLYMIPESDLVAYDQNQPRGSPEERFESERSTAALYPMPQRHRSDRQDGTNDGNDDDAREDVKRFLIRHYNETTEGNSGSLIYSENSSSAGICEYRADGMHLGFWEYCIDGTKYNANIGIRLDVILPDLRQLYKAKHNTKPNETTADGAEGSRKMKPRKAPGSFQSDRYYVKVDRTASKLGEGCSSTVWPCTISGAPAALKQYRRSDQWQRKEAHILARANHPNIVRYFCASGKLGIVLERLCYDLQTWYSKQSLLTRLAPRQVFQIGRDVLCGLSYLHSVYRILHRQPTTEHVLLDEGGHAKLCGFGAAKYLPEGAVSFDCDQEDCKKFMSCYVPPEARINTGGEDAQPIATYYPATDGSQFAVMFMAMVLRCEPSESDVDDGHKCSFEKFEAELPEADLILPYIKRCLKKSPEERVQFESLLSTFDQQIELQRPSEPSEHPAVNPPARSVEELLAAMHLPGDQDPAGLPERPVTSPHQCVPLDEAHAAAAQTTLTDEETGNLAHVKQQMQEQRDQTSQPDQKDHFQGPK
eukprot:scpid35220/ scgid24036/ Glycogen synthase kinase-3